MWSTSRRRGGNYGMGRPPKLVSLTRRGQVKFAPSSLQWSGLEKALGAKLSPKHREEIARMTAHPVMGYLSKAAAERAAPRWIDAKGWLVDAASDSEKIAKRFTSAPAKNTHDAIYVARAHVYARLGQILRANGHTAIPIDDILVMLPIAVKETIRHVGSLESKGDGAWRNWVCALNKFFTEQGLPTGIRKDALGSAGFVHFLMAIQKLFPAPLREHIPTEEGGHLDAIAGAAYRALRNKPAEISK
jgi:hypothetical protein